MAKAQRQAVQAFDHVVEWLEHFEDLDDPRQFGKAWYPLDEVLLLCLFAVHAGAEGWVEVEEFGQSKLAFLRRYRAFKKGTPRSVGGDFCRPRRGSLPAMLHQLSR